MTASAMLEVVAIRLVASVVGLAILSVLSYVLFQAEDGIRDIGVTGVQTCALPIFLGHHGVRPDDAVVAHGRAAQDAGAVADPAVVAHPHVALVDALQADRALDLHHAVVEVDQHRPVGDDALAADRDMLEDRHGALLPQHGLRPDRSLPLVHADLRPVPDPRPA